MGSCNNAGVSIKNKNGKTLLMEGEQNGRWAEHFKDGTQSAKSMVSTYDLMQGRPDSQKSTDIRMNNITAVEVLHSNHIPEE